MSTDTTNNEEKRNGATIAQAPETKLDDENIAQNNIDASRATDTSETESEETSPAELSFQQPYVSTKPKKSPLKKLVGFAGAILVLAALAVTAIVIFSARAESKPSYVLYLKDKKLIYSNLKKPSPFEVSGRLLESDLSDDFAQNYLGICRLSNNNKLILYPDRLDAKEDGLSIYYRSTDEPQKSPEKLDSNVRLFFSSDDGKILAYIKGDDRILYLKNENNKEKIDSNVSIFYLSDDGKKLIYKKEEGGIYFKEVSKDTEKIDSEGSVEHIYEDFSTLYYIKNDALYKKELGKDSVQIAAKATETLKVYNSGEIYFYYKDVNEIKLSDYIDDDMMQADILLTAPERPIMPSAADFDSKAEYEQAEEEYEAAKKEYEQAYDEYKAKQERDSLRDRIAEESLDSTKNILYYYDGKEAIKISDNIDLENYDYAVDKALFTYHSYSYSETKKAKLSELINEFELEGEIHLLNSEYKAFFAIGKNATEIKFEDVQNLKTNRDGSFICFSSDVDEEKKHGDLYKIKISGNVAEAPEKFDSEVYPNLVFFISDGRLAYFKDLREETADLYIDKVRIDYDIYWPKTSVNNDLTSMSYITDWNENKQEGTLKYHKKGEVYTVADEVHDYEWAENDKIAYLQDYTSSTGTLFVYRQGKDPIKIDDDVLAITI